MSEVMRPEDVPEELVGAGAEALAVQRSPEGVQLDDVRIILAGALSLHGQQLRAERDQARAELETLRAGHPDEWGVALTEGDTSVSSAGRHENVARHAVELDPAGRKLMYRRGPSQWREIPASAIPPVEQETVYDASGAFVMHRPRLGAAGRKAEGGGDDA